MKIICILFKGMKKMFEELEWFDKHKKVLYEMLGDIISNPKEFLNRNLSVEELTMLADMFEFQLNEILKGNEKKQTYNYLKKRMEKKNENGRNNSKKC